MKQDIEVITTVQLPARPAAVLDHQYDQGQAFAKIASFWPRGMAMPDIGVKSESPVFLCRMKTASGDQNVWPIGSPEETLASAFYFYLNAPSIFGRDVESLTKVASELASAMQIYDLQMPAGFADFCKQAALERSAPLQEEVWAVEGLPVTSATQTIKSCELFEDNADRWSQADQVLASTRLKTAALAHGVEWNHHYAIDDPMDVTVSGDAIAQLEKRAELARDIMSPRAPAYINGLHKLAAQIPNVQSLGDIVQMVDRLDQLDRSIQMQAEWGRSVREPAGVFLLEGPTNPLGDYDTAYDEPETNWSMLDLDKLASYQLVAPSLMEQLQADPYGVVEQLPEEVQAILKHQFMRG